MKPPYTTTQLAKVYHLEPRIVITYEERGLARASVQAAKGRGSQRLWSYEDAVRVGLVRALAEMASPRALRAFMAYVDAVPAVLSPDRDSYLLGPVNGQVVEIEKEDLGLIGAQTRGFFLWLDIGETHRYAQRALAEL